MRASRDTVEIHHDSKRVAVQTRSTVAGDNSARKGHRPSGHCAYAGWMPASTRQAAQAVGPATAGMADAVLPDSRPDQAPRTCAGVRRLGREYGSDRLEAACRRGLSVGAASDTSLQSILARDLDRVAVQDRPSAPVNDNHANVRGTQYYQ